MTLAGLLYKCRFQVRGALSAGNRVLLSAHQVVECDTSVFRLPWWPDNDNDNDTLREVPHPSNEGLALQARV